MPRAAPCAARQSGTTVLYTFLVYFLLRPKEPDTGLAVLSYFLLVPE